MKQGVHIVTGWKIAAMVLGRVSGLEVSLVDELSVSDIYANGSLLSDKECNA